MSMLYQSRYAQIQHCYYDVLHEQAPGVTGRLLVVTIILLHWDGCCKVKVKKLKLSDIQPSMVTRTRNLNSQPFGLRVRLSNN